MTNEPSLYINATLFRPYGWDIPSRERYYEAFEWLMKSYGGKPHWAKNWTTVTRREVEGMYEEDGRLEKWLKVREEVDPEGVFLNGFIERMVMPQLMRADHDYDKNNDEKMSGSVESFEMMRVEDVVG